jgi:hypothetical protein
VYDDVHILMVIISIIVEGQKVTEDVVYKIPNGCYESLLPVVGGRGTPTTRGREGQGERTANRIFISFVVWYQGTYLR